MDNFVGILCSMIRDDTNMAIVRIMFEKELEMATDECEKEKYGEILAQVNEYISWQRDEYVKARSVSVSPSANDVSSKIPYRGFSEKEGKR